jgi:hypothetical protein
VQGLVVLNPVSEKKPARQEHWAAPADAALPGKHAEHADDPARLYWLDPHAECTAVCKSRGVSVCGGTRTGTHRCRWTGRRSPGRCQPRTLRYRRVTHKSVRGRGRGGAT